MKKMLVAVCVISIVFATTAIAAETYTEKFVQSKTQKIVDKEKAIRAKDAENKAKVEAKKQEIKNQQAAQEAKVKAQQEAIKKKQAKDKAKLEAKKNYHKQKVETKKKQVNELLKY